MLEHAVEKALKVGMREPYRYWVSFEFMQEIREGKRGAKWPFLLKEQDERIWNGFGTFARNGD